MSITGIAKISKGINTLIISVSELTSTLIEIAAVGSIGLTAFVFQHLAAGLFISLIVFRIIRAISRSSKLGYYQRALSFHYQDLKAGPHRSRRFFF